MSVSDWRGLLEDPAEAERLFARPPDLSGFDLSSLHVDERDAGVTLGFAVDGLPDRPRTEWVDQGLNAFEFFLAFTGVADLAVDGWSSLRKERISIEPGGGAGPRRVHVEIAGPDDSVRFSAASARWAGARAYLASRSE